MVHIYFQFCPSFALFFILLVYQKCLPISKKYTIIKIAYVLLVGDEPIFGQSVPLFVYLWQ